MIELFIDTSQWTLSNQKWIWNNDILIRKINDTMLISILLILIKFKIKKFVCILFFMININDK